MDQKTPSEILALMLELIKDQQTSDGNLGRRLIVELNGEYLEVTVLKPTSEQGKCLVGKEVNGAITLSTNSPVGKILEDMKVGEEKTAENGVTVKLVFRPQ